MAKKIIALLFISFMTVKYGLGVELVRSVSFYMPHGTTSGDPMYFANYGSSTMSIVTPPAVGTVTLQSTGFGWRYRYAAPANYVGDVTYQTRYTSGVVGIDGSLTTVTVHVRNPSYFVQTLPRTTVEDGGTVLFFESEPVVAGSFPHPGSMSGGVQPAHGFCSFGTTYLHYTPTANYVGSDSIFFLYGDRYGVVYSYTLDVTVSSGNDDPPVISYSNTPFTEDQGAVSVPNWITTTQPPDENQTVTIVGSGDNSGATNVDDWIVPPTITNNNTLVFHAKPNVYGPMTMSVTATDAGGNVVTQNVNIVINPVDDGPAYSSGPNSYSLPRNAGSTLTSTLAVVEGQAWYPRNATNGPVYSYTVATVHPDDAAMLSAFSFNPIIVYSGSQRLKESLRFTITPADTLGGVVRIQTITYSADLLTTYSNTIPITITPVNHTPTLYTTGDFSMPTIVEDDVTNAGALISAIIATSAANGNDAIADVEGLEGVVVDSINIGSLGVFEFSTDGGSNWTAIDNTQLTAGNKLHLAGIANTRLRFVPVGNSNNSFGTPSLSFRAWDQSDGTTGAATLSWNGTYRTTSGFGAYSPYSSSSDAISITVNPVNDVPSFVKGADQVVNEDASAQSVGNWATSLSKGPSDESGQTLTFTVTNNNNSLFSVQPAVSSSGTLSYTLAANANGVATISVTLSDDGGTANGGVNATAAQTATITVNPVNDVPSFVKGADQTVGRNAGAVTVSSWATGVSAGASNESSQTLTFIVSNNNNSLFTTQPAISSSGTLTYTPADTVGGSATVTISLQDNGGTANGGVDTTSDQTFIITIAAVNHQPTLYTTGTFSMPSILEDDIASVGASIQAIIDTSLANGSDAITDVESLEGVVVDSINIGSLGVFEFSIDGGSNWTAINNSQLTAGNKLHLAGIANTRLRFVPTGNSNSDDGSPSLSFRAWDQSDGTTGAATPSWNGTYRTASASGATSPYSSSSDTISITVTTVNDAPIFIKGADQSKDENAPLSNTTVSWATNISKGSPNESAQSLTFVVSHDNAGLFAVAPAINSSGNLSWTFNPNVYGEALCQVSLQDNGGTANGGVDTSAAQSFVISKYPVTPTVTSGSTTEDVQSISGLVISKNVADVVPITSHYKITNIQNGTLFQQDGTTQIVSGSFITLAQGAAGLRITPTASFNGNATFVIQASRGPNDLSLLGDTITATCAVLPVNQAPSFAKGANQSVARNAGTQSVANWATSISKGPANESVQTLTFLVSNDNAGLFTVQPAISTSGTLSYTPADTAGGSATVTVSLQDDGGTANGGSDTSAAQTFTITIVPANHKPTLYNTHTFTLGAVLQNTASPAGEAVQAIIDSSPANVNDAITDVEGGEGYIIIGQSGNGTLGQWQYSVNNGSDWVNIPSVIPTNALHLASVANNKIRFIPVTNINIQDGVPTLTVRAWDQSDGTTGAVVPSWNGTFRNADSVVGGNYNLETSPYSSNTATVSCEVTPVNQVPSFAKGANQVVDPVTSLPYSITNWATGISKGPTNTYENAQTVSFVVTNDANAQFSVQPTIAANGTLSFTLAPNAFGVVTLDVQLQDNGGTANGGVDTSAVQTFTITIISITPSITSASTLENIQTTDGLVISRNVNDTESRANFFKITNIQNGTLFQNDGTTPVANSAFITFAQANAGLKFTPAPYWNNGDGVASIQVQASLTNDNTGLRGSVVTGVISVGSVNQAPSFVPGTNQTVYEGSGAQTVTNWATSVSKGPANESGQTVTFQVSNDNTALFSSQPAISATGTLTYTLAPNIFGVANVAVICRDNGGTANGGNDTAATVNFVINVLWANQPPTFTLGGAPTVLEDSGAYAAANWISAMSPGPTNNELSQNVTYTVSNNNNALFATQPAIAPNGTLTFTPAANAFGTAIVSVFAVDDGGTANGGSDTSAAQNFNLAIVGINDAPSFTKGADIAVSQAAGLQSFPAWATSLAAGPSNENGQVLSFNVTVDNPSIFAVAPAISDIGTLTLTPSTTQYGSATVTVRMQDNGGTANGGANTSPPQTFMVSVGYVNQAPSFTKGADQTLDDSVTTVTVSNWATNISRGPNNANENAQTVSFIVSNDNTGLFSSQPAISATGTLTYTLIPNALGSAIVTVYAQDNGGTVNGGADASVTQSFTITAARYTPNITATSTVENTQTTTGLVITRNDQDTAPLINHFKVTDIQNGTLYHNDGITTIPNGTFISFAQGNAGLKFTPTNYFNSTYGAASFKIRSSTSASNIGLLGNEVTAVIYVDPINQGPVNTVAPSMTGIGHPGVTLTAVRGTWVNPDSASAINYAYQWQTAFGSDGTGLISVGGATATSYFVPVSDLGRYVRVQVTATDTDPPEALQGGGSTTPASATAFSPWILITNQAPIIAGTDSVTVAMSENSSPVPFSLTLTGSDSDADVMTWTITGAPSFGTAGVTSNSAGTIAPISYSPTPDYSGTDVFIVTVTDPSGASDSVTVNVIIQPVNNPPVNTTLPTITGSGIVGTALLAVSGVWNDDRDSPTPGILTFTYQWQRATDTAGTGAINILGATSTSYQPVSADAGKYVRVVVTCLDTATNGALPATVSVVAASTGTLIRLPVGTLTVGSVTVNGTVTGGRVDKIVINGTEVPFDPNTNTWSTVQTFTSEIDTSIINVQASGPGVTSSTTRTTIDTVRVPMGAN